MVQKGYAMSKAKAAALSMLTSEAGLAAMHAVLAAQAASQAAVVGAVRQGYWASLLAQMPRRPHMYGALDAPRKPAPAALPASQPAAVAAPVAAQHQAVAAAPVLSAAAVEAAVRQVATALLGTDAIDPNQPLGTQGLDSLASLELRQKIQVWGSEGGLETGQLASNLKKLQWTCLTFLLPLSSPSPLPLQDQLGVELMVLLEDPQAATISAIVAEAVAQLAAQAPAAHGQPATVHVAAYPVGSEDAASTAAAGQLVLKPAAAKAAGPLWISPAPFSVKMRLFCLPYAAGISENVFAKWVGLGAAAAGLDRYLPSLVLILMQARLWHARPATWQPAYNHFFSRPAGGP